MQADEPDAEGPSEAAADAASRTEAILPADAADADPGAAAPGGDPAADEPDAEGAVDADAAGGSNITATPLGREFMFDPSAWPTWAAVAMLRWMMRDMPSVDRLVYRSKPSLSFSTSEIHDVGIGPEGINLVLAAPGLAAPGSALPLPDVARIVADWNRPDGGALAYWMDGLVDRLMQAAEVGEARTNAAFSLATGGDLGVVDSVLRLAGFSAPLYAEPGGVLSDRRTAGVAAPGLARMFVGDATAAGLRSLVSGFTGLDVIVEEFVPVDVPVARPLRLGSVMDRSPIGREGEADAGVNVILDGTEADDAAAWVRDPQRADSLASLCAAYVGGTSPQIFLYADLAPDKVPPAALDGATAFGRAPLLGAVDEVTRVPIEPLGYARRPGPGGWIV